MAHRSLFILILAVAASAIQVGYDTPAASSYIYRSDNGGPASLIQLGAQHYKQPVVFAAPLPLAQPLKLEAIEAYDLAPAPLPYIADKPGILADHDDDDDDDDDSAAEYIDGGDLIGHGHGHEEGGGSDFGEKHQEAHGEKGDKGYHSKGHHEEADGAHYGKGDGEGFYNEKAGGEKGHHDEADAHGKHYAAGKSYKGGDHGHKKHFSKGEDVTGYHKVFHKDEFKKDHDFYDVADKSGHFNKHAYEKEHHAAEKGGHKKGEHQDAGFDKGGYGKTGFIAKGHKNVAGHGHSAEKGGEAHYANHDDFGKKGESGHNKEYGYGGDDGDDDDDDDDHHDDHE